MSLTVKTLGAKSYSYNHDESLGFLVSEEKIGDLLLLEIGPYAVQELIQTGSKLPATLFVSHNHFDHCGGLPTVVAESVLGCATTGRPVEPRRIVWGGATEPALVTAAKQIYPFAFGEGAHFEPTALLPGESIDLSRSPVVTIEPLPCEHSIETFGLIISSSDSQLAYIPDSRSSESLVRSLQEKDIRHALVSCFGSQSKSKEAESFGFMAATQLVDFAASVGLETCAFFHGFFEEDRKVMSDELSAVKSCNFIALSKGMELSI